MPRSNKQQRTGLVAARMWGRMVALRGMEITDVAILDVAAAGIKVVDPNGEMVRTARELGIEFGAAIEAAAAKSARTKAKSAASRS